MKSQIELPKFSEIISWAKWATMLGAIITATAWLHTDFRAINADMRASQADVRAIEARLDNQLIAIREAQASQNARTDQLYSMFIDLLKDQKENK